MASRRVERVRSLLKREIGEAIRRELPVGEAGLITVNDVDIGGDLRNAKVFISILGGSEQQKNGLAMLEKNRVRIQGIVGKAVILKFTPQLRFVLDDSVQRGNRVLQILDEIEKSSPPEK
jgi:ribosome-binding factor A